MENATVRRRIGLDDVFTAFFSTVAFASAVVDGNRRTARQQEWVTEIEKARSELDAVKADQERRISRLGSAVRPSSKIGCPSINSAGLGTWQDVFTWAEEEICERKALGFEAWRGIPLKVLKNARGEQIQTFLDEYPHFFPIFKGSTGQDVWDTVSWPLHIKKVRTLEWSVARLALELMRHVPIYPDWDLPDQPEMTGEVRSQLLLSASSEFHSTIDHFRGQLKELENGKRRDDFYHQFESPRFPRYNVDQPDDSSTADELNAKLHALFESSPRSPDRITKLLPSICYYLLSSRSPPSIHTYNLLLSDFAGGRRHDLIGHLLRSMSRTHIRSNEITHAETLRHYLHTRQCSRFDRYVDRMEGFEEGLGLAAPQLDIPDLLQFQYRVRVNRRDANGKSVDEYFDYSDLHKSELLTMWRKGMVKIYEKARRNLEVHQVLIQGALRFHGMFEAMKHYCTMISEGWQPNVEILLSILHRCLVDCDWDAGITVWRQIQASNASADERGYIIMLQLCQKANKLELIEELLQRGIQRDVLPPTVLEMGWHESALDEKPQDFMEDLSMGKDMWILKQGLEELLEEHRHLDHISHETSRRIDLLRNRITEKLRRPNHKTAALLREAGSLADCGRKFFEMDMTLRESESQILSITNELHQTQLGRRINQLEDRLTTLCCAITQTIRDTSSIFFSTCVATLEDCSGVMLSSTAELVNEYHTLVLCDRGKRLRARFDLIDRKTHVIRTELAAFVASILGQLVSEAQGRLRHLKFRIDATSGDVEKVIATIRSGSISFRNIGSGRHRRRYQNTVPAGSRNGLDAAGQQLRRQGDRVGTSSSSVEASPGAACVTPDVSKLENPSRSCGGVVRIVGSTPALIRMRRVKDRREVSLHQSQTGETQSPPRRQASKNILCDKDGRSGMIAIRKPPLPANASETNCRQAADQIHRSGHATTPSLGLAYMDINPSVVHELGYG
ncbi:MAG: hypothetical protein LQ346_003845 [Caloplaca aetnensis]|nr:MAG: hypothetical protein LQ346_003845 [Caloplaca aetnensis]